MTKKIILSLIILGIHLLSAQVKWVNKNMFEQKNFIENKGQFDARQIPNGETILHSAKIDGVQYYFTKSGYTVERRERVEKTEEEIEKEEKNNPSSSGENEKEEHKYKIVKKFHELNFKGANTDVNVVSENEVSNYYSYGDIKSNNKSGTIIAHAFKKITYTNIYPNTDVVFEFPKDSTGIEYSIILHPGAEVENVKLAFPNNKSVKLINNTIEIESSFGKITDHQPSAFLAGNNSFVKSNFIVKGNEIGFELGNYDHTKTVIIDPWTVTPNFGGTNSSAFDVDYDNQGNVYAYGGVGPFELVKYSASGALVWTFTPAFAGTYYYYGDFAVDRSSNAIYLVQGFNNVTGANAVKINSNAIVQASFPGDPNFNEMWRISFSRCTNQAVIAGGGVSSPTYQTCMLDTTLASLSPVQFVPSSNCCHDACMLALDNYGNCYQITPKRFGDSTFNNSLIKLPLPALLPITYSVPSNYLFGESTSNLYCPSLTGGYANGYNGITTSGAFVYTYDGYVLKKWDGPTGNLLVYKRINFPLANDSSKMYWGGLSTDGCGNLFLGDNMNVRQYDSTLLLINTYAMPDSITDVNISNNGILYVCGSGYVAAVAPTNIIYCQNSGSLTLALTSTNATCTTGGSATAIITGGNPPFNISWNTIPQQSGQTITNVPAGTYTVTLVAGSCNPYVLRDSVTIGSTNGIIAINSTTPDTCGSNNGTATCTPIQGTSPYSFSWSNGQTTQTATGLYAGIDTCTITDGSGCTSMQVLNVPSAYSFSLSYSSAFNCNTNNGTATVFVSGGVPPYTYFWSNGQTTQTVAGLQMGSNSCMVTDSLGCHQLGYITISNSLVVTLAQLNFVCANAPDFLLTGGSPAGGTYSGTGVNGNVFSPWVFSILGYGNDTIVYTYTDSLGCSGSDSSIFSVGPPIPTITDVSGVLYSSNAVTYSWYTTSDTLVLGTGSNYTPTYPGFYYVTVTDTNGCSNTSAWLYVSSLAGIQDIGNSNYVTISPNPFTSQTTITFSQLQKNTTIKIMDVLGQEIKSINFTGKQFILEKGEMDKGIYFVQITDEKRTVFNTKIVIQ